jgi:hypothetical protein
MLFGSALRFCSSLARRTLRDRTPRTILLLASAILGPFLLHGLAWLDHVSSYNGICGPHAPDIAAHPCTREVYNAEFNQGFGGIALLASEVLLGAGIFFCGGIAWMIVDQIVIKRRERALTEAVHRESGAGE